MSFSPAERPPFALPIEHATRTRAVVVAALFALLLAVGLVPQLGLILAGAVIGVALLIALSTWPYLGVCMLITAATFESVRLLPAEGTSGTISKLTGAVVVAAWAIALLRGRLRRPSIRASLPLIGAVLFVAWSAVTIFWSEAPDLGVSKLTSLGMLLVSVLVAATSIRDAQALRRVALVHIAVGIAVAVLSVFAMLTADGPTLEYEPWGTEAELVRSDGFAEDPNEFAAAQLIVFSLAVALTLAAGVSGTGLRLISGGAAVLVAASIIATLSRGGLFAFAVVVGLWLASRRRALLWIPLGVAAAAAAVSLGLFDLVLQRVLSAELDSRLLIWDVGLGLWREHFLFGIGVGGFPDAFFANQFYSGLPIPTIGRPIVAHNTFLSVAAETGLVGLLLFLGVIATTLGALISAARRSISASLRPVAQGYFIGFVGFLVAALFLTMELDKWLWLVVGLAVTFAQLQDAETGEDAR